MYGKFRFLIIGLLVLLIAVPAANFAAWFWHTRAIVEALSQFQKELAYNNIVLEYDEPQFKNFKSWRAVGEIPNVRVTFGMFQSYKIAVKSLRFTSFPFKSRVALHVNSDVEYSTKNRFYSHTYRFEFEDPKNTALILDLAYSIGKLSDLLRDHDLPKFHIIDSLDYHSAGVKILDGLIGAQIAHVGENHLKVYTQRTEDYRRLNFDGGVSSIKYDPNYPAQEVDAYEHKLASELGNIDVKIKFEYTELPSSAQLEMLKTSEARKKGLKKVFDSYNIAIDNFDTKTDKFTLLVKGNLDKQPFMIIPNMNINLDVDNYPLLIDYQIDLFNASVIKSKAINPLFPINPLNEVSRKRMHRLAENLSPVDNNLRLFITKEQGGEIYVSGKSVMTLAAEFMNIFEQPSSK